MRVLVVEPGLADDGARRVSLDRAARWAGAGADVRVLVLSHDDDGRPVEVPAGLDLRHVTPGPARFRRRLPAALRALVREARRADVVVSGREIGDGLLGAALAARATRTPLAVTVQSSPSAAVEQYVPPRLRALTWRVLRRAHRLVAVSPGLERELGAEGVPAERLRTVPNGVDVAALRAAADLGPDAPLPPGPLVVAVGRLTRQKGFDLLVRAHARALADGAPPHHVLVVGEGPDRAALEDLVRELGVEGSVTLGGFRRDVPAVLAAADLFVLPSRGEGFVLVLAEAAVLGVPVVATDCVGGPGDVLRPDEVGAVVPVEDVPALARALAAALEDGTRGRAAADVAGTTGPRRLSAEASAESHRRVLAELVGVPA